MALRGVGKVYANGLVALDGLSLTVHEGEFLGILGPSGCGKSTILRLIAGLGRPTSGTITRATPTAGVAPNRHDIGFVFQDPTLLPWATLFDNVQLPLRLAGMSRNAARERVLEALALVRLDGFAAAYPRELSGGMRMRASLARALVTRPRLLLLDEPFAALDEIERFRLNDELLALRRTFGWTVLFVSHSVFESVNLCERLLVMTPRPGRIAEAIDIAAPYPRDSAFRGSPAYAALCGDVSLALGRAAGEPS